MNPADTLVTSTHVATSLQLAAVLVFAIGLVHSVLGERYLLTRLFRRGELPQLLGSIEFTQQTLRMAWHITTIAWWGVAVILWLLARDGASTRNLALALGAMFLCSALASLALTRGRHLSWIAFALCAALTLLAAQ
jgi:hypothetical protein